VLFRSTIVIHGEGKQTRDYVFMDDVVNAAIRASSVSDVNRLIINVGSGRETSVNEIVRLVTELSGTKPEIVHNQHHDSGPSRMCADISLAQKKLGYRPSVSLREGLLKTMQQDKRFHEKN
jgi:UDP-glucose 4-epimerase